MEVKKEEKNSQRLRSRNKKKILKKRKRREHMFASDVDAPVKLPGCGEGQRMLQQQEQKRRRRQKRLRLSLPPPLLQPVSDSSATWLRTCTTTSQQHNESPPQRVGDSISNGKKQGNNEGGTGNIQAMYSPKFEGSDDNEEYYEYLLEVPGVFKPDISISSFRRIIAVVV